MAGDRTKKSIEILAAVDQETPKKEDGLIHLSTGVVLGTQPIPKLFIRKLYNKFEESRPKVPTFVNPDKDREEENPADPDYIKAMEAHDTDFMFAIVDLAIMRGTHIVSKPDNIEGPLGDNWVEEQEYLGIPVPKAPNLRYMNWVTFVAAPTDEDQQALAQGALRTVGITEAAVEAEMTNFPSDSDGKTDTESPTEVSP